MVNTSVLGVYKELWWKREGWRSLGDGSERRNHWEEVFLETTDKGRGRRVDDGDQVRHWRIG